MGRVMVVGLGPGDEAGMTGQALAALRQADIICGYDAYVELARPIVPNTPVIATGMKQEVERCRQALAAAAEGKAVAVVCSGDPGVYGMAGLIVQLAESYPPVDIDIIPGVSAAMAGAALLGAPLMHDFAVISLSDLLTPWETIVRRLDAAASADFVICLYNPASKKRHDNLQKACDIVLRHRAADTICGWTRHIGREGQDKAILPLAALRTFQADMFTTVFIGSTASKQMGDRMVTPRGYQGLPS